MRIAIGGFLHESHSFAPRATGFEDFLKPGGFPPLLHAAELVETLRPTSVCSAGAIAAAEAAGAEIAPLAWGFANPAGPVTREAFERISALILAALSDALPVDGVFLELHGAMVSDDFPDAEGELLRRARAVVGPGIPIAATLDPHANMTPLMARMADVLVPYRTYPHVDMRAMGVRATELLLQRIARKAPWAMAFRELDFLIPITSQCTMVEPMAGVMAARAAIEAQHAVELAYCFGFPYADFDGCGQAIAAWAETQQAAQAAVDALAADIATREAAFAGGVMEASEAVARARRPPPPHRHRRHAGQSRRRRPWRHDGDARRTPEAGGGGCRARPYERRRGRGSLPRGRRGGDGDARPGRQERRRAPPGDGRGGAAERRALHAGRPDGQGQPGQSRPDGAAPGGWRARRHRQPEDAGA
jgi:microcystin degradation protein MlrC